MKKSSPDHKPTQDEASIRRAAAEFDWIVRWRREILSAGNVSEKATRTIAQLSDFELALYLAGKNDRNLEVAALAACTVAVPPGVAMTATPCRTRSDASVGRRSS